MKLYLVRHGQTSGNAQRIHQDNSVSLSELGVSQSTVLAKRFQTVPVDLVIASPYARAQQTAEIIGKTISKPIQTSPLLIELKRPSVIEGRHMDDPEVVKIKEDIESNVHNPDWKHSDEETFFDIRARAITFLKQLDSMADENVLVVTHGHFIKAVVGVMMYGEALTPVHDRAFTNTFAMSNTSITACERKPGERWTVLQWNDDAHLGELA